MKSVRSAKLLAATALVVALGLAAAGCGGSSSSDTTTTAVGGSATVAWANGVCNAFGAWKASIQRAKTSVAGNPSTSALQNAGNQVRVSTQGLFSSLQQLGRAPTQANAAAQQSIDTMRAQLQSDRQKISSATNLTNPTAAQVHAAAATVRTSVASMSNSFTSTVKSLQSLDPGSELGKAFHQAKACEPFFA